VDARNEEKLEESRQCVAMGGQESALVGPAGWKGCWRAWRSIKELIDLTSLVDT